MEKNNGKGRQPDYKGDGVAIWINNTKEGKKYLSIKILGSISLAAFKNEPRKVESNDI